MPREEAPRFASERGRKISAALRGKPKSEAHKVALRGKKHKSFERTESHRQNISQALTGIRRSNETKQKISKAKKGRPIHSEEAKRLMSETRRGENSPMYGYQWSAEQRESFSKIHTGQSSMLVPYGISREEYATRIAGGERWCVHRKHFSPAAEFPYRDRPVCIGCRSEFLREGSLKKTFGVDHQWYLDKLAEQGGGCAICGSTTVSKGKNHLSIDHNHATGAVRGVLCAKCNMAMERMEAVPNWGALATAYLVKYAIPAPLAASAVVE